MEAKSLASGLGGRPLGTERLSTLPSLPTSGAGETGRLFAREVERATERSRGDGLRARRLGELESDRRAARRAGFGGGGEERRPEAEPRTRGTVLDAEHIAVVAPLPGPPLQEKAVVVQTGGETLQQSNEPVLGTASAAGLPAEAAQLPGLPASAFHSGVVARALPEGVAIGPAREAQPLEGLASERSGAPRGAKRGDIPQAAAGADPAQMERATEILRQIRLHASPGVQRLTLDLEPVDLGRLSIQLALRAGKVTAIVRAESPETLELLQQREADLAQLFSERGIEADSMRFELGFGGSRAGHEARERSPSSPERRAQPPVHSTPEASQPPLHKRGPASQVDTYA